VRVDHAREATGSKGKLGKKIGTVPRGAFQSGYCLKIRHPELVEGSALTDPRDRTILGQEPEALSIRSLPKKSVILSLSKDQLSPIPEAELILGQEPEALSIRSLPKKSVILSLSKDQLSPIPEIELILGQDNLKRFQSGRCQKNPSS
jgi:hypothetical protein